MNSELIWDKPHYFENNRLFIPQIFDSKSICEDVPHGFNGFIVPLKGGLKDEINWDLNALRSYITKYPNHKILWDMDLGLFPKFPLLIEDQLPLLTLGLSLEHFRDTIWQEFREKTLGICLYRGKADFTQGFIWDREQELLFQNWLQDRFETCAIFYNEIGFKIDNFADAHPLQLIEHNEGKRIVALYCRDIAAEFLGLLANRLPDALTPWVLLDGSEIKDTALLTQLVNQEIFEHFQIAMNIKGSSTSEFIWESGSIAKGYISQKTLSLPGEKDIKLGICLSPFNMIRPSQTKGFSEVLKDLHRLKIPYRLIPESTLISDWDGLDYLIVFPSGLSPQGKRKLQGFCAASGIVISLGENLGLPQEITFQEYLENRNL
jgi:hypothetical protein